MARVIRQPVEDMYGRPTGPRHEDIASGRETPGEHTSLDDLPDGESVQSDRGETPVPATTRQSQGKAPPAGRGAKKHGQTPIRS